MTASWTWKNHGKVSRRLMMRCFKCTWTQFTCPKLKADKVMHPKKTRHDVEQYRLRFPESSFGCIMANYGYSHLLSQVSLKSLGLFGTLLVLPDAIRFLSVPEVLMMMGALEPCWLPLSHRTCMRILGNGIATQHALLAIGNGIAFLRDMSPVEVHEMMSEALSKRMTASNIRWEIDDDGVTFNMDLFACRPTLVMHPICQISLKCPTETVCFRAERGVVILECLRLLTGDAMPNIVSLLPGGDVSTRVSLPCRFEIKSADVHLFACWSQMCS